MANSNLTKGGPMSMINRYIARKRTVSALLFDACGTFVPELCPVTTFLEVIGRNRGSTKLPEVFTT